MRSGWYSSIVLSFLFFLTAIEGWNIDRTKLFTCVQFGLLSYALSTVLCFSNLLNVFQDFKYLIAVWILGLTCGDH